MYQATRISALIVVVFYACALLFFLMLPIAALAEETPASTAPTAASEKPAERRLVAVLDLKHGPDTEGAARALTAVLTAEIGAMAEYRAVSRNELQSILAHQADAALMGCESVNCMADIAKLVDAQLIVSGSVEKLDQAYVLALTLVDPSGPTILNRQEVSWRGSSDDLVSLVRPYVDRLFAGPAAANFVGQIEIFAPDGALAFIDGQAVGAAPFKGPIGPLSTGVHTLYVSKDGSIPYETPIVVSRGETAIARIDLVEEPFYTTWWFWGTAAGSTALIVAGGATAGALLWSNVSAPKPTRILFSSPLPAAQ